MKCPKLALCVCVSLLAMLFPLALAAQTNCDAGNGTSPFRAPQAISVQDLVQKFAGQEACSKMRATITPTHRK